MEKRKIKNNNNYPKKLKIMNPLNYLVLSCGYIYVVFTLILIIMGNLDVIKNSNYTTAYKISIAIGGLFFGSSMKNLYSFLLNSIGQKQYTKMQEIIQQSVKTFEAITSFLQILTISLSILALVSNTFVNIILFFLVVVAFLNYILGLLEL